MDNKLEVFLHTVTEKTDYFQVKKYYLYIGIILFLFYIYMYKQLQVKLADCNFKLPKEQQIRDISEDTLTTVLGNLLAVAI